MFMGSQPYLYYLASATQCLGVHGLLNGIRYVNILGGDKDRRGEIMP